MSFAIFIRLADEGVERARHLDHRVVGGDGLELVLGGGEGEAR